MPPFAVPGQILMGKYRVERVLGKGGMGTVLEAVQLGLDRKVALKCLTMDASVSPDILRRFEQEARITARLRSEHAARVLDIGRLSDDTPCIVMEYLEGSDLEALTTTGPLPVHRAVTYVLQACEAVAEAHAAGIIHRDLKPANLFLTERVGGRPLIKVLDFGISKLKDDPHHVTIETTGGAMGTPQYMSPEQLESAKDVTPRSDIWSLGAILYELVTGKPPFAAASIPRLCVEILNGEPVPMSSVLPEVSPALEDVVRRCLEKRPEDRFSTVGELASALAPFAPPEVRFSADVAHLLVGTSDRPSMFGGAVLDLLPSEEDASTAAPLPLVRRASSPRALGLGPHGSSMPLRNLAERAPARRRTRYASLPLLLFAGGAVFVAALFAGYWGTASLEPRQAAAVPAAAPLPAPLHDEIHLARLAGEVPALEAVDEPPRPGAVDLDLKSASPGKSSAEAREKSAKGPTLPKTARRKKPPRKSPAQHPQPPRSGAPAPISEPSGSAPVPEADLLRYR